MPDKPPSDRERISAALQRLLDFTPGEAQYLCIRKFLDETPERFIPKLELISNGLGARIGKQAVKAATILRFPLERIQHHVDRIVRDGWTIDYARQFVFGCPDLLTRTEAELDATFNALAILIPKPADRRFFMNVKPRVVMIPAARIAACAACTAWDDDPERLWTALAHTPMPAPTAVAATAPMPTTPRTITPVPERMTTTGARERRPSPPPALRPVAHRSQPPSGSSRSTSTRPSTTTMRAIPRADETPLPRSSRQPMDKPPTPIRPGKVKPPPDVPREEDEDEFHYILDWRDTVRSILRHSKETDWETEWKQIEPDLAWIWISGSNGSRALTSLVRWLNLRRFTDAPSAEQAAKLDFLGRLLRSEKLRDILRLEQRTLEFRMAVMRRLLDLDFRKDPGSLLKPWETITPDELRYRVNEIVDRKRSPGEPPFIDILLEPTRETFLKGLETCLLKEKRRHDPD